MRLADTLFTMNKIPKKNKVYIVNKSGHVYDAASAFGDLVFVTEGTIDRYDANGMWRIWHDALDGSAPEDYLLLTSLNVLCAIGAAVFAKMHGRLNLLLYSNGKYIPRELVL